MAKSNGFWGESCAGFAGCESAHGARANVHRQRCASQRAWATVRTCTGNGARTWAVQPARQSLGNGAVMWATVFLGLAARLKDTCSVRFALHKSLKNQRIKSYVQVSC